MSEASMVVRIYRWLYEQIIASVDRSVQASVNRLASELGIPHRKLANTLTNMQFNGYLDIDIGDRGYGSTKTIRLTQKLHPCIHEPRKVPIIDWPALNPGFPVLASRKTVFEFIVQSVDNTGELSTCLKDLAEDIPMDAAVVRRALYFLAEKNLISLVSYRIRNVRKIKISIYVEPIDPAVAHAEKKSRMIAEGVAKRRREFLESERRLRSTWRTRSQDE